MDLATFAVPQTVHVHLEHPTAGLLYADKDKKQACTIELLSPADDRIVAYQKKVTNRQLLRNKKGNDIDANYLEDNRVERLCQFTVSVNNIELSGVKIDTKNIEAIYRDPNFGWLYDQLETKISSWKSFLTET